MDNFQNASMTTSHSLLARTSTMQQNNPQENCQNSTKSSTVGQSNVQHSIKSTSSMTENTDQGAKSLMDKWRDHYHNRSSGNKTKIFAWLLFQFQAFTQLYITMVHLVPFILADYSDMTQYYFKIIVCYLFTMTEANWLCAICYSSRMPDMRDRPDLSSAPWLENQQNGHNIDIDTSDRNGLRWKFCDNCKRYKPPRTHHCLYCKTCILRRDHHCYLVGTCIGHYNQRYFIVMCFFTIWVSALGFPLTLSYLSTLPDAIWWGDYVLPYTIYQFIFGSISLLFLILTFHCYMLCIFGILSVLYFLGQLSIVSMGKTLYEVAKNVQMRVTTSVSENFKLVFGDYWLINFLFPAQIIFKQRHDGMHYDGVKIFEDPDDKIKCKK